MGVTLDFPQHLPYFDICYNTQYTTAFLKLSQQSLPIIRGHCSLISKNHAFLYLKGCWLEHVAWWKTLTVGDTMLLLSECWGVALLLHSSISAFAGAWQKLKPTKSKLEMGGNAAHLRGNLNICIFQVNCSRGKATSCTVSLSLRWCWGVAFAALLSHPSISSGGAWLKPKKIKMADWMGVRLDFAKH